MTYYELGFMSKCAERGVSRGVAASLLVKRAWSWPWSRGGSKPAQPEFDYSNAEIDTSVGNNGYSRDVPTFAFYKGEPAELRRQRFNKEMQAWVNKNQAEVDAFGAKHGIKPTAATTAGAVWDGLTDKEGWKDGAKLVGKGFVDTAADLGNMAVGAGKLVGSGYGAVTGDNSMKDYFSGVQSDIRDWQHGVGQDIVSTMGNPDLVNNRFVQAANALQRFGTAGAIMAAPGAIVGAAGKASQAANAANTAGRASQAVNAATKAPSLFQRANQVRQAASNGVSMYNKFDLAFNGM